MKKKIVLLLSVCVLVGGTSYAQGKIGYVGTDDVFGAMPEVMRADSSLAAYQQALSQSYQEQQDELNAAYAKFTKDSAALTPVMKEVRRKDLQDRIAALQNREQELNKMLETEKEKQLKPIREKM
ncbi:MAG TPA: OmpH family outer membrane protein, partial [Ferruginibacter sp.]|nr:OmpH family outer membrane protein [Ferruginibacter sp.]